MRGRIALAGAVLLVAAGSTACDGHHSQQTADSPVRRENSVAKTPPPRLADAGPAPGALVPAWTLASPLNAKPVGITEDYDESRQIIGGQIVEESVQGIDVYDAQSGQRRWFYREPDRQLIGYAATDGMIVADTIADGSVNTQHWTGMDAATGRILWSRAGEERAFVSLGRVPLYGGGHIIAGAGVIPVHDEVGGTIRGINARTGRVRWTENVPVNGKCADLTVGIDSGTRGDGSVVPLSVQCGGTMPAGSSTAYHQIVAIDPATGHRRWSWNVQPSALLTSNGYTLVSSGNQGFSIVGPSGHQVTRSGPGPECSTLFCDFVVTAGYAVFPYEDDRAKKSGFFVVDTRTGRTTTTPPPGEPLESVAAAGGLVYAATTMISPNNSAGDSKELLPGGLEVIDPATATIQRRPLPFAVGRYDSIGIDRVMWLGVAGRRLYVGAETLSKETVTAYTATGPPSPSELGGVPVSAWPDACTIAPGFNPDLHAYDPRRDDALIGSIRLRRHFCHYDRGESMDASIAWVAATPAEAQSFLTFSPPSNPLDTVRTLRLPGVDAAYSTNHQLWIRAGRYIVRFYEDDSNVRKLAEAMAKTLRSR